MSRKINDYHRKILSMETGTVVKDWGGKIPIALVYANTYGVGMSNLGFQAIYRMLNQYSDVVCERFFLPDPKLLKEYERTGTRLTSMESGRSLDCFDLAAFSLSFENDYINVVRLLKLAGIPWRQSARGESDPIFLAGGVAVRLNPEPLADFIDFFLIGDGEKLIPDMLQAWRETLNTPLVKKERLLHLARSMSGFYAPEFYEPRYDNQGRLFSFSPAVDGIPEKVVSVKIKELPVPALSSKILTPNTEFKDTRLIELGRGCGRGCRFCLAGHEYRPPRLASLKAIYSAAEEEGTKRVGLVSPAVMDHPEITTILKHLYDLKLGVTVSSIRAETLTPELVELLIKGGLRSGAIAPETGSERLRGYINKNLTDDQILDAVIMLAQGGLKRIKLYFMIGLPSETLDDVKAIGELTRKIKDRLKNNFRKKGLIPELILTVASFVPKPGTPFETFPMEEVSNLKKKAKLIRTELKNIKGVRVHFDAPKMAWLQAVLARGDRRISGFIEDLALGKSISQARKESSVNLDEIVSSLKSGEVMLPWDFIDRGFADDYLNKEGHRALKSLASPDCDVGSCVRCGVCPV